MNYLVAIPLLPAAVFLLFFVLPRRVRNNALWLPVSAMAVSLGLSLWAFTETYLAGPAKAAVGIWQLKYAIGALNGRPIELILRLDAYAAMMLIVVTIVGFAVQIYSLSYMHGEERIGWYYGVLSLFTAAMLLLVMAGDYLLFYMSWEVMGLCSYLLIGFWNKDSAARNASIKAFLVTRVGDVGFAIGLVYMWNTVHSFNFHVVLPSAKLWPAGVATTIALLLFFGAMGKSAQVPLHVWLPDAMAGPTPASALIHAATMVAAGVFLVARSFPIFEASGTALHVVLVIGGITALLAATMGCVQYDIKKVLAYSTISQLGFMFLALGAGSTSAALFHLFTHAFFKSLLFLGAGSIIHSLHTQDMREMGGVSRKMRTTTVVFTIGTFALIGLPGFAGFFSKDSILDALWVGQHYVWFSVALLSAALTAFYMTRLWLRVFPVRPDVDEGAHAHESDWKMLAPMVVLALLSVVAGWFFAAVTGLLGSELEPPNLPMALTAFAALAVGVGFGWVLFGQGRDAETIRMRNARLYRLVVNKYFFDTVSDVWIAGGYMALSKGVNWFDREIINGIVNGVGVACRVGGQILRDAQTGRLRTYQRVIAVSAIVLVIIAFVVKGG